jgi:hypothetical protein
MNDKIGRNLEWRESRRVSIHFDISAPAIRDLQVRQIFRILTDSQRVQTARFLSGVAPLSSGVTTAATDGVPKTAVNG